MGEISKAFWQVVMGYVAKACMWGMAGVWFMTLSLHFCFTSNYFINNFENSSFVTKTSINFIRSFRHNCRIVWGTILPIDPSAYPGVSLAEIEALPSGKNSLYKIPKRDVAFRAKGMRIIAMNALSMERTLLGIFLTSEAIYANTMLSKMQLNYDFNRLPASKKTELK